MSVKRDRYDSITALRAAEIEGESYRVVVRARAGAPLVVAPHGGTIEPGTSAIAAAVAGSEMSLFLFEGRIAGRGHAALHVASHRFDDPAALALAAQSPQVVAIHGRGERGDPHTVWVGGRDTAAGEAIAARLRAAGFDCVRAADGLAGTHPSNICNRGMTGAGVQLELPARLRRHLVGDKFAMGRFAEAVRAGLADVGTPNR